jgi:hypothetical protein
MDDEEIMKYGVLGEDAATTPEKLEKYTGEIAWSYLKPHFESGALLFVDPALELTEVGIALTTDQVKKVDAWKKNGDLVTPSQPHADFWAESNQHFKALVVSPFVLAQPTASPALDAEESDDTTTD